MANQRTYFKHRIAQLEAIFESSQGNISVLEELEEELGYRKTQRADTLEKRIAYQTLDSLQEYVLVAQDKPEIVTYRRIDSGWEEEIVATKEDTLRLLSVGLQLPLAEVYEDIVGFDEPG